MFDGLTKRRLLILLAALGPGIITAAVDNDAGGIATYSIAGAEFGYSFLWTIIPIAILLIVTQEMCIRMGIVTEKGLSDLIRENFGIKITFALMIGLLLANLANVIANFAGIAASLELFGLSRYVVVPLSAAFVWLLIFKGSYKSLEKAFLIASVFYVSYIIAGIMANPDWGQVATSMITPQITMSLSYMMMFVALVGTTIAPWMQFYIQSSAVEKGLGKEHCTYSRIDVILGSFVTVFVLFFIIVTCAATLHANGVAINSAEDAALALKPFAGEYAFILFAFGLLIASLFAAAILPLATAYFVCEAFGWNSGVNKTFEEAPWFYILITALIAIGALFILLPDIPLILIMYISQVLNGLLLPVILVLILLLVNNKKLMGEYVNGRILNVISWASAVILSVMSLVLVFQAILLF